jgi:hypothetical protein
MNLTSKIASLAAAMLLVAGIGAFASEKAAAVPVGQKAAVTQDLAAFFAAHGADPQYLNVDAAVIPASELAKIMAIVNTADDTTVTTDDHDVLNRLVSAAMSKSITAVDSPVYLKLGTMVYQAEEGSSADDAWIAI